MNLLEVRELKKTLEGSEILGGIDCSFSAGEKVAIAGATGSGKSTLLRIIAGLTQPDSGEVFLEGVRIQGPLEKLIAGHPRIAYLSQQFELRNHYRVEEVLEYANNLTVADAQELFRVCRIDHLLKRWTSQLSGGERQRIALARLLIGAPRLLLLDEPFSNLDMIHKTILKSVLRDLGERLSIDCVLVSHDALDTLAWADKIIVLADGKIIQQGTPREIYHHPVNQYVAGLFGNFYLFDDRDAQLFMSKRFLAPAGKKIFTRPEYFRVAQYAVGMLPAKLLGVSFAGNLYNLDIELSSKRLRIPALDIPARPGDTVYIRTNISDPWFM